MDQRELLIYVYTM